MQLKLLGVISMIWIAIGALPAAFAEPSCLERMDTVYKEALSCENLYCKLVLYNQNARTSELVYANMFSQANTELSRQYREVREYERGRCEPVTIEKDGESRVYCEAPAQDSFKGLLDIATELKEARTEIDENIWNLSTIMQQLIDKLPECLGQQEVSPH